MHTLFGCLCFFCFFLSFFVLQLTVVVGSRWRKFNIYVTFFGFCFVNASRWTHARSKRCDTHYIGIQWVKPESCSVFFTTHWRNAKHPFRKNAISQWAYVLLWCEIVTNTLFPTILNFRICWWWIRSRSISLALSPPLLFIRFFLFYDKIQNILLHMRLFGWIELMSNIKWNEQVHPTWNTN